MFPSHAIFTRLHLRFKKNIVNGKKGSWGTVTFENSSFSFVNGKAGTDLGAGGVRYLTFENSSVSFLGHQESRRQIRCNVVVL